MRLGAVLLSLHVAVEPSEIRRAGATVLLAKLGGATGPYLSFVHDMPLAELELELIQSHMAQKLILRGEVDARALCVRSVPREGAWASAGVHGAWVGGCGCEANSS